MLGIEGDTGANEKDEPAQVEPEHEQNQDRKSGEDSHVSC